MHIALVGPTHPFRGGISHYSTLLCARLRERHEVDFYTFYRQYPGWLFPGRSDRDEVSERPLTVAAAPVLDGANPLTWLRLAWRLRRERPERLVLHWTVPYWIPMLWTLVRFAPAATRVVVICHNADPHEQGHPLAARAARWAQRKILSRAALVLCHAASDAARLRARLPDTPVEQVMLPSYAALLPAADPAGPAAAAARGEPALLFFGFVRPYKGVEVLLEALPAVRAALPGAHLTIAGEWWAGADPASLIPPSVRDGVTVLDRYQSNEEMAAHFAAADVVVLPYTSATQSAVVQSAFACGVPVITTDAGGLPEAVAHEVSGLIVPAGDAAALAAAIVRYQREGWRARLEPGVAAARDRFSWAPLVGAIERAGDGG